MSLPAFTTPVLSDAQYKCDLCEVSYTEKRSLDRHCRTPRHCRKLGVSPPNYSCRFCQRRLSRNDLRLRHENEKHLQIKRSVSKTSSKEVGIALEDGQVCLDSTRRWPLENSDCPVNQISSEALESPGIVYGELGDIPYMDIYEAFMLDYVDPDSMTTSSNNPIASSLISSGSSFWSSQSENSSFIDISGLNSTNTSACQSSTSNFSSWPETTANCQGPRGEIRLCHSSAGLVLDATLGEDRQPQEFSDMPNDALRIGEDRTHAYEHIDGNATESGSNTRSSAEASKQPSMDKCIRYLKNRGVDIAPKKVEKIMQKMLVEQAFTGGHKRVKTLLACGASLISDKPVFKIVQGRSVKITTAVLAASYGNHGSILELLAHYGARFDDIDRSDKYGSALCAAAATGAQISVETLLSLGADPNLVGGTQGTPLACAARQNEQRIVEILLRSRADPNGSGGDLGGALEAATLGGHTRIVEMLLDQGADPDKPGGTIRMRAWNRSLLRPYGYRATVTRLRRKSQYRNTSI